MNLLLDTSVFLWWEWGAQKLGPATRAALVDPGNQIFISAVSFWEIAIKRRKGKLKYEGSLSSAVAANGFFEHAITAEHAEAAGDLSWDHADPFDRLLVAQSRLDSLVLVHADDVIAGYRSSPQIWALQ